MSKPELKRILLAEDEPDVLQVATMALEMLGGFEVVSCTTGSEVVALAESSSPQLILLDVMMPGMDGPGALAELQKHPQLGNIPVVFLTAKAMKEEVARLLSLGARDVITKPFVPEQLSQNILDVWNRV